MEQQLEQEIIQWHIATFPQATLESQILKFQEERQETEQADTYMKYANELADCYICILALGRYGDIGNIVKEVSLGYLDKVREENHKWYLDKEIMTLFIKTKMEKNRKRKWRFINGVYKHLEVDDDRKYKQ